MHDDALTAMLSNDFEDLAATLERDRVAKKIIFRVGARQRARQGVIVGASCLGGIVAASQFSDVASAFAASVSDAGGASLYASPQFIATLVVAAALTATAFVMRREV